MAALCGPQQKLLPSCMACHSRACDMLHNMHASCTTGLPNACQSHCMLAPRQLRTLTCSSTSEAINCHGCAGNCASLRMDALLNSDALTLMVLESLPLWYFPILVGPAWVGATTVGIDVHQRCALLPVSSFTYFCLSTSANLA